jgi:hypothetical protein
MSSTQKSDSINTIFTVTAIIGAFLSTFTGFGGSPLYAYIGFPISIVSLVVLFRTDKGRITRIAYIILICLEIAALIAIIFFRPTPFE